MASDPRDYKLDIGGMRQDEPQQGGGDVRPYLGIRFNCCGVYQRVYRSADGRWYRGRCPRCLRAVEFRVGEGGSDSRFFVVD